MQTNLQEQCLLGDEAGRVGGMIIKGTFGVWIYVYYTDHLMVYISVKTQQIVYFKYVQFTLC